jgi:hypothetical protein
MQYFPRHADHDPADFRWELRNIIVYPEILPMMDIAMKRMRSLSKLVIDVSPRH